MGSRIIRDEKARDELARFICTLPAPFTVTWAKGAKRSDHQNRTFHMWCGQVAAQTFQSAAEVKAFCKLTWGEPILAAENADWLEKWKGLYSPLPYAKQLVLFECIPVTSVMTTRQKSALMDAMRREYATQGIVLTDPEIRKYEGAA